MNKSIKFDSLLKSIKIIYKEILYIKFLNLNKFCVLVRYFCVLLRH